MLRCRLGSEESEDRVLLLVEMIVCSEKVVLRGSSRREKIMPMRNSAGAGFA